MPAEVAMILQVPFVYTAHLVVGRKRNPDEVKLAATVACALREVSGADAPVVMWWAKDSGPQECIRHHEGVLYAPLEQREERYSRTEQAFDLAAPRDASPARRWGPEEERHGDDEDEPEARGSLDADADGNPPDLGYGARHLVSTESFAECLRNGWVRISGITASTDAPLEATHEITDDGLLRSLKERGPGQPVKRVASSGQEAIGSAIARSADSLLSVDGVLFRKVERPVYVLRSFSRGDRVEMHRSHAGDHSGVGYHPYAPESFEAMKDVWRGRWQAAYREWKPDAPLPHESQFAYNLPAPDIVRPDLLPSVDETDYLVREGARSIVDSLARQHHDYGRNGPYVANYPRDVILGYGRLRDALAESAPAAEIADLMARLGEACSPHGTLHDVMEHARFACARAEASFEDSLALGAM